MTYEVLGSPPVGTVIPLSWAPIGSPVVDNRLYVGPGEQLPTLIDSSITIGANYVRGDADNDGMIGLTDVLLLQEHFFLGGEPAGCAETMDINADGALTLSDIILLLYFQFLGGAPPAGPFPGCDIADIAAFGCDHYTCP